MKDINKLYEDALEMLVALDIHPYKVQSLKVTKSKRWGSCTTTYNRSTNEVLSNKICLSNEIMADETPYDSALTVMIHELLHACKECHGENHGGKWLEYAELVNDCYNNIDVQRVDSRKKYKAPNLNDMCYVIKCADCGHINKRQGMRSPKWFMHPENYRCSRCKGNLVRVGKYTIKEYNEKFILPKLK